MTEQLTLGVIGHVDHGKTALVRALTGIDTDRLKEEKERGVSIVLGFSYLQGGRGTIDLIDVPGHQNFVRTMISGATGIDGALLIVAANEGVMPQTREHLDIAQLLGVDRGLIVITKQDLVNADELELVTDEVRSFVAGTFLDRAKVLSTSTVTNNGLCELRAALDTLEPVRDLGNAVGYPFLPIDRVFVMRGFGPVVTGTLRGGHLKANRKIELLPGRRAATIRGLQVHNKPVEQAAPGQRVAVNLRNIKREDVRRGDIIALPGTVRTTCRIDAELRLLESHKSPLRNAAIVRLLAGTSEVMAKVRLLDRHVLEPGAKGLVQLRIDREIAIHPLERFVIRSYSPMRTIGGGRILDAHPSRHRRFDPAVTDHLHTAASGSLAEKARMLLAEAGPAGATLDALSNSMGLTAEAVNATLAGAEAVAIGVSKLLDASTYERLRETILTEIDRYHDEHPNHFGMTSAKLRTRLSGELTDDVFGLTLDQLRSEGRIENHRGILRLTGFDPLAALTEEERRLAAEMEETIRGSGLATPAFDQVVGRDKTKQLLFTLLCDTGKLVRLKTNYRYRNYVLHADTLDDVIAEVRTHFSYPRKFALSEVREMLGSTRKYTVPLMEHLDATGVTLRIGNLRQLGNQDRL
ncbi:MAG: selenocysteine-specific translation elongation factor [Gammaproteobacteria bacterium]|nr:selenocysteine-specific translation elongation factor [Gammaproteobacteria bacterium]